MEDCRISYIMSDWEYLAENETIVMWFKLIFSTIYFFFFFFARFFLN